MPSWKKLIVSGSDAAIPSVSNTGDFTIDAGGDIILDADGTDIKLKDGGTEFGSFKRASSDFIIKSATNDKDIVFKGEDSDGGGTITALTLDMSEAGNALFNANISGSQIEASGDVIAFGSSDERLKDNITPIGSAIDKLNTIGGYEFDWNNSSEHSGHDVGVIAQEIEKVLPEVVVTRGNGYKAVRYEKIVALLIQAIKEQQSQIDDLKSRL